MTRLRRAALAAATLLPGLATAQMQPYAGQQGRDIKALSAEEAEDLLAGRGMGLARAAELNGHPGPMHVLDLRDRLALGQEQADQVRAIQDRMSGEARATGAMLVEAERALDRAFASAGVTPESLSELTGHIGALQGRLRAVHLLAHIETRAVLTPAQIASYDEARGYAVAAPAPHRHHAR